MPCRSSARVSSAVWFCIPPRGSNFTPLPTSAEGGGSKTEQSLSTLIRLRSVLLISQESPEEPIATFSPRPPLHTTLISLSWGKGELCVRESTSRAPQLETAATLKEKACRRARVPCTQTPAATGLGNGCVSY